MAGPPIIEIRVPGQKVRRVIVDRAIEIGRDCDGEVISDEGVVIGQRARGGCPARSD